MKWSVISAASLYLWLYVYSVVFLHKSGSVVSERSALSLFFFSCPQHGQGIRSSTSQSQQPPMAEWKKDEGAGDPIKILLEDALEKKRNVMMDKFEQILQWLPTDDRSTSSTSANKSTISWTNPTPNSAKFIPPWRNLMQWRPLLPKEGGMIQVDIGGHPPIPFDPRHQFLQFFTSSNLLFLAGFWVLHAQSHFSALMF